MNCKDCKHWTPPEPEQQHGVCHRIEYDDDSLQAYVIDWEGCKAELRTKDDFGCILWEAIPKKDSEIIVEILDNRGPGFILSEIKKRFPLLLKASL